MERSRAGVFAFCQFGRGRRAGASRFRKAALFWPHGQREASAALSRPAFVFAPRQKAQARDNPGQTKTNKKVAVWENSRFSGLLPRPADVSRHRAARESRLRAGGIWLELN
jgi:hypothetical protein